MTDRLQNTINQLSLVMTIPEDLVKACKENDLSPAMVENLLRLHNQQVELEKAVNELRSIQYNMAQTIGQFTTFATGINEMITDMSKHIGFDPSEIVSSEKVGQEH